jgi:hypothetical protein
MLNLPNTSVERSIGRIDNDKGYEPGNLRWETPREQAGNKTTTVVITFNDTKVCFHHFIEEYTELSPSYALKLYKQGHSLEELMHWKDCDPETAGV